MSVKRKPEGIHRGYKTVDDVKKHLDESADPKERVPLSFHTVLAHLTFDRFKLDDNVFYRWVKQQVNDLPGSEVVELSDDTGLLRQGCCLQLQVLAKTNTDPKKKARKAKWWNWVHIAPGTDSAGSSVNSVYASRDFPKGAFVGVYAGPSRPVSDDQQSLQDGATLMPGTARIVDNEGKWRDVEPSRSPRDELHLGFQYAGVARKNEVPNCVMDEEGLIRTNVRLVRNDEILLSVGGGGPLTKKARDT